MSHYNELKESDLSHCYQPSDFDFQTTDDVKAAFGPVGQEEAIELIDQGLKLENKACHLFICCEEAMEIDELIIKRIEKTANTKNERTASGYLYNFKHPENPHLVELPAETANAFKADLEEMTTAVFHDIPLMLDGEAVRKKQKAVICEFESFKAGWLLKLSKQAEESQLQMKLVDDGIKFVPVKDIETMSKQELIRLQLKINELEERADEAVTSINEKENWYAQVFEEVRQEAALREISKMIRHLKEKYKSWDKLLVCLNEMAENLLENIELIAVSQSEKKEMKKEALPWLNPDKTEQLMKKYDFNIITMPVKKGPCIINDHEQRAMELAEKVLMDVDGNGVYTDYSLIKPGLLNLANHGFLLLHMDTLIERPGSWKSLKYMLRTGKIPVENAEAAGSNFVSSMMPEQAVAQVRIILIGSESVYELMESYDETFKKYFKVKVNLYKGIKSTRQNIEKLAGVLKKTARKEKIPSVTTEGLLKMIRYSARVLGNHDQFHSDPDFFTDLMKEAGLSHRKCIDGACIEKVIEEREKNDRILQKKLDENIINTVYLISTEGRKTGQVNGLAVYETGKLTCGRPVKITATTYRGQSGIIDIEGTAKLSGAIHTKGVHIITGFLGNQFAQDFPLALNCNICFEQNYTMIDGDSASSTELYAIISSLAELPVNQYLAVTGSMNQFGEIQPIGGINEKIEGFFKICSMRGLKGNEGVIMPKQNTRELLLSEEVIEGVRKGMFHIYEIENVWDGMELLMNCSREEIKKRVYDKLKKYSQ